MVLVTEATENVDKEPVDLLLKDGVQFRIFVRDPRRVEDVGSQIEIVEGDLNEPETLNAAMQSIDRRP